MPRHLVWPVAGLLAWGPFAQIAGERAPSVRTRPLDVAAALAFVGVAVVWLSVLPHETRLDWLDVGEATLYFVGAAAVYVIVRRWGEHALTLGWLLFTLSLFIEVLDEFTLESRLWGETVPFALGALGLAAFSVGLWRHTRRRDREFLERDRVIEALAKSHSTLEAVVEGTPDVVTVRDLEGRHLLVNSAAARHFGRPATEIVGKTMAELAADGVTRALSEKDLGVLETGETVTYEQTAPGDGAQRTLLITKAVYRDHNGFALGLLRVARDITERKRAEAQLVHDAAHDVLTGLPNRARFVEELSVAISRTKRRPGHLFAVLFLDLDRFKVINDSLGHAVGDEMLTVFARMLRGWLRPMDFVARMSGDEFTVLLDDLDHTDDATRVVERIAQGLRQPLVVGGREIFASVSVGIALSATGYDRPDDVLRDADLALYRAKAAGRARYAIFDVEMHARAMARLQLETDLRHAVERGEFRIAYQPIVALETQRLVGFEALLRWQHATRGLLRPDEFLAVADETGLMVPIGKWVLGEALGQLAAWQARYPEAATLTMSTNVSGRQLVHPHLVLDVREALEAAGLASYRLRIEVTESVIMEYTETAVERLRELRALGVQLDMDDFGTGYSSLSHLQRFPLQAVKIDRSFVERMKGGEQAEIVKAILTLGRQFGLDVVAEGVETGEQQALLVAMGCPHAQGYLFSQPVTAAEAGQIIGSGISVR